MVLVSQIIDSDKLLQLIDLPLSLRGKKVEVIVRPIPANEEMSNTSSFGCLSKYANPSLIDNEINTWEKAILEKHADS